VWLSRDDAHTLEYCSPDKIDGMHKVVLEAADSASLEAAGASMLAAGLKCKVWREQPEDFVTAVASAPGPRSALKPHFVAFKLMR
jgi:hypothetical protein